MTNALPVEYHYEFYVSRYGDPFWSVKTPRALAPLAQGDFLDHRTFTNFPLEVAQGSRVRIESVEHIIWEIENDHVGHKVMVVVQIIQDS